MVQHLKMISLFKYCAYKELAGVLASNPLVLLTVVGGVLGTQLARGLATDTVLNEFLMSAHPCINSRNARNSALGLCCVLRRGDEEETITTCEQGTTSVQSSTENTTRFPAQ